MKTFYLYFRYIALRGFLLGVFFMIFIGIYFIQNSDVTLFSHTFYNPIYTYVRELPTWLFVVKYLITVFIMAFVIIFIYMLYYYLIRNLRIKIYSSSIELFANSIFDYMYAEKEYSREKRRKELRKIKSLLNSDYKKRIFLNLMQKVNVQIVGYGRERNLHLLNSLQYDYLIYAYLHSPLIRHKMFALKIISAFQLEDYDEYIMKLAKSKNNVLHTEALVTIINLRLYDSLQFLNDYNIKLTVWDIDIMLKTIQKMDIQNIDYLNLLNSSNAEISTLGLMLIRINYQNEFKMEIKAKISHQNELVSEEAFLTFITFAEDQSDYDFLIYTFEIASEKTQLLIVQAIENYQNTAEKIKFLNWVVENKSLVVKISALQVLTNLDLNSIERLRQTENMLIRLAILEVLDYTLQ